MTPPHYGHLILASEAVHHLQLDRLEWILTPEPPHKPDRSLTPVKIRQRMVEAAIAGNSAFLLSRVDLDRQPPYYAAESLEILRERRPEDELFYLIGADSLCDLPDWYQPQRLLDNLDGVGVMPRPGAQPDLEQLAGYFPGIDEQVIYLPAPRVDISSSLIRERAANNQPYRYFLPEAVRAILVEEKLYLP